MKFYYWEKHKAEITKLREERESVELELCKKLYERFSEKPLLQVIQLLTHYAIADIYAYAKDTEVSLYLDSCYKFYRLWKKKTQERWEKTARSGRVKYKIIFGLTPAQFELQLKSKMGRGELLYSYLMTIKQESLTWLFDPGDCADILCMYGDFVEKCKENKDNKFKKSKDSFAKAFSGIDLDDLRMKKREVSKDQEEFFKLWERDAVNFFKQAKDKRRVGSKEFRARIDRLKDEQRKKKYEEQREKLIKRGYLISPGVAPGLARYKLTGESSLKQVDKMFGLRKGGDISGTTADTVFAIEALLENFRIEELGKRYDGEKRAWYWAPEQPAVETLMQRAGLKDTRINSIERFMGDVQKIRNILCLLPLASMGYQGHHTILECAVTLTINDYIDYHLGLYTTLLPRAWFKAKTRDDEKFVEEKFKLLIFEKAKQNILKILEKYEKDKKNHWMVLSFKHMDSEPVRCIVFDKDKKKNKHDVELFENLSWLSMNGPIWLERMYSGTPKQRFANEELVRYSIGFWESFLRAEKLSKKKI